MKKSKIKKPAVSKKIDSGALVMNGSEVFIYSAVQLTGAERDTAEKIVKQMIQKTVHISYHVDPKLIGGIKITLGDYVVDMSIQSELGRMSTALKE